MIIDVHAHIFNDKIASKAVSKLEACSGLRACNMANKDGLIDEMGSLISKSVILPVATNVNQVLSINDYWMSVKEEKFIIFGSMHPDYENYKEELKRLKDNGVKGIKIHPEYQGVYIDDLRYVNIIDEAFSLGMMVITHAGVDIGIDEAVKSDCIHIINLMTKLKNKGILILAHMGGWKMWENIYELAKYDSIYFDTSFSLGEYVQNNEVKPLISLDDFNRMIKEIGSKRFLFGSDFPWMKPEKIYNFIEKSNLTDIEKENIYHLNFKRLLKESI